MPPLSEDQARTYMHKLLAAMVQGGGSDLFIAADFPPSIKAHGSMQPMTAQKLNGETTRALAQAMMN
jgi:twitching motility protein PilU